MASDLKSFIIESEITSFSKTMLLQLEIFLTMLYTNNSSQLLVTKLVFVLAIIIILSYYQYCVQCFEGIPVLHHWSVLQSIMQLYKYSRSIITTDSFSLGQASLGTLFVRKYNIKHRSNSYLYIISIEHYFQS